MAGSFRWPGTELRAARRSELLIHHEGVNESVDRMLECLFESTNYLKSQILPEPYCAFVRRNNEVKLHRAIPAIPGVIERMQAHGARDSAPCRSNSSHVSAIANVASATGLIPTHLIRPENDPIFLGYECFFVW